MTQQAGGVLRVAGTINEPATVRIDGRPATVDASGVFVGGIQTVPGTTRFTVTATDASGNTASQPYDVDQLGEPKVFTFDANGNLTSDGTRTFEWDARNQLLAMSTPGRRSDFTYDGYRRRVSVVETVNGGVKSTARVLWCGTQVCEDRGADGMTVVRRSFGLGQEVGSTASYFARDHLGSPRHVTNGQGTVLASYSLDPWGRKTLDSGTDTTRIGFTGHVQAQNHVSLTLYRAYDAGIGRWLSEDPASFRGGINLYGYVSNNPIGFKDPLGLRACAAKPCDELLKEILNMAAEVSKRFQEYNSPKWRLPLTGKMSRKSHLDHIDDMQRGIRNRIQDYNDQNCPAPLHTAVEEIATRPLPQLTPSAPELPELPPPTPEQVSRMGQTMTVILVIMGFIYVIVLG